MVDSPCSFNGSYQPHVDLVHHEVGASFMVVLLVALSTSRWKSLNRTAGPTPKVSDLRFFDVLEYLCIFVDIPPQILIVCGKPTNGNSTNLS